MERDVGDDLGDLAVCDAGLANPAQRVIGDAAALYEHLAGELQDGVLARRRRVAAPCVEHFQLAQADELANGRVGG